MNETLLPPSGASRASKWAEEEANSTGMNSECLIHLAAPAIRTYGIYLQLLTSSSAYLLSVTSHRCQHPSAPQQDVFSFLANPTLLLYLSLVPITANSTLEDRSLRSIILYTKRRYAVASSTERR
jgi:hypothetical protein